MNFDYFIYGFINFGYIESAKIICSLYNDVPIDDDSTKILKQNENLNYSYQSQLITNGENNLLSRVKKSEKIVVFDTRVHGNRNAHRENSKNVPVNTLIICCVLWIIIRWKVFDGIKYNGRGYINRFAFPFLTVYTCTGTYIMSSMHIMTC